MVFLVHWNWTTLELKPQQCCYHWHFNVLNLCPVFIYVLRKEWHACFLKLMLHSCVIETWDCLEPSFCHVFSVWMEFANFTPGSTLRDTSDKVNINLLDNFFSPLCFKVNIKLVYYSLYGYLDILTSISRCSTNLFLVMTFKETYLPGVNLKWTE